MQRRISELEDEVFNLKEDLRLLKRSIQTPLVTPLSWGLSPMPKKILELIYTANGMATYERIYHACYAERLDPPSLQVLTVHISNMRRKLKKHGIEIKNHWGEGFSMPAASKKILAHHRKEKTHG